MSVFVDTSAWYALLASDDEQHALATAVLGRLADAHEQLVTHNYVLIETLALAQRRLGMAQVLRLADDLLPLADIEWIQPSLHDRAFASYRESGRGASFVDQVSFTLMRARDIRTAFAFDADFTTQGFELLT